MMDHKVETSHTLMVKDTAMTSQAPMVKEKVKAKATTPMTSKKVHASKKN